MAWIQKRAFLVCATAVKRSVASVAGAGAGFAESVAFAFGFCGKGREHEQDDSLSSRAVVACIKKWRTLYHGAVRASQRRLEDSGRMEISEQAAWRHCVASSARMLDDEEGEWEWESWWDEETWELEDDGTAAEGVDEDCEVGIVKHGRQRVMRAE
jgi:hypothetical protein